MSIVKFCKITCNFCGKIEQKIGDMRSANRRYKETGGIIIGDRHFCSVKCYKSFVCQLNPKSHKTIKEEK